MISGAHIVVYSRDAEADRAFFRDILGFKSVDAGHGWLIFRTGPSEMGVHPTGGDLGPHHEISLMCDDIEATRSELAARGATFASDVLDRGFGLTCMVEVPGADPVMLYEPRHATAYDR